MPHRDQATHQRPARPRSRVGVPLLPRCRYPARHPRRHHRPAPLRRDRHRRASVPPAPPGHDRVPAPGPGTRQAGFQLHHQTGQAIAAGCLHALGFDPHAAATADNTYPTTSIEPFRGGQPAPAPQPPPRLTDHIQAVMDDADTSAAWSAALIPGDGWEVGTGAVLVIPQ